MPKWVKILHAAQIGMGWTDERLAEDSRTPLEKLRELKGGLLDPGPLRSVARSLRLGGDTLLALAQKGEGIPTLPIPKTLRSIEIESGRGYLLWDSASRLASLIDVGGECPEVVRLLEKEFLVPRYLFFTEPGRSVDSGWARLLEGRSGLPIEWENGEREGSFPLGTLRVDCRRLADHKGASWNMYLARGLEIPVAFIGRLLLPPSAEAEGEERLLYQRWLEEVRSHIFTLSDETLLCPSGDSITSVGFEKAHNPFFPEFEHFSSFANLTEENRNP